ncbi:MAG TPA: hypothetical protein VFO65_06215 [Acidimicrobiales bacterium]|nr:hypothetical protein [Acidimicrobiales bacterium]
MHRALLALTLTAVVLAGLSLPAGGQTAPPPVDVTSITPNCGPRVLIPQGVTGADRTAAQQPTVTVRGTARVGWQGAVNVYFGGQLVGEGSWSSDRVGTLTGAAYFTPSSVGYYRIEATDGITSDSMIYSVPCRTPTVTLDPPCSRPGQSTVLTVTGRDFLPGAAGYVYYDYSGPNTFAQSRIRIPIDAAGTFATSAAYGVAPFSVTPPNREVPIFVTDQGLTVTVRWAPCPPPGVTTTTSTVPPDDTTTTSPPTVPPRVTVTLPPGRPTTTTSTTSTTVPPPTPGAALTVTPGLGPPGFVALAAGTGFPPGPVEVTWSAGIGATAATAGDDGTFTVRVLIFPRDRLGPRLLVATAGAVSANAPFLVVPPTIQPAGGGDVAQINRTRRFIQR